MKHNIELKNIEQKEEVFPLVEKLIAKLESSAKSFSPDVLFLRILVEANKTRSLYSISMTMSVPGKTLATREERHDMVAALRDAFGEIDRQLKEHKSRLRAEHLWKRIEKRAEIRQMKVGAEVDEQRRREIFFSLVSPQINKLEHVVRQVIRYSESTGELARAEIEPDDVVDATLLRAYQEFQKEYPSQEVGSWLIRRAMDVLDSEVASQKREREQTVRIEEDVPETEPTREVSTLGDEIFDFYQPDEDLKLEDIVPDIQVQTPEQLVEAKELRRLVRAVLAGMPRKWRIALVLHDVAGQTEAEVAKAVGKPETEVRRIIKRAREFLRRQLTEYGYDFKSAA